MLKKSFVFVMLLAASLIGISSAVHHQPEVATAQPQTQQPQQPQQSPQQGQIQSPSTAPPTLGKRLTGPQGQQQQQSNTGTLVQIQQDKALVDRLFPYILQKLDGKTLAQKIDVATLLQKIDAKTLAAKILPHMQVKISGSGPAYSDRIEVKKGALDSDTYHHVYAKCPPGDLLWSGGGHVRDNYLNDWRRSPEDNWLVESGIAETGNQWKITAKMSSSGDIYAEAICRKITLGLVP